MQKIMFNDRYGLTQAVIEGRKTMTRRLINLNSTSDLEVRICVRHIQIVDDEGCIYNEKKLPYKVGEIVAVAQSYEQIGANPQDYVSRPEIDGYQIISKHKGWRNKMYVRAELMPHQIRITGVRTERLQEIPDEECVKEGIWKADNVGMKGEYYWFPGCVNSTHKTPREAFAALIDKVSGKGTWERNPWVWVYEFELVK